MFSSVMTSFRSICTYVTPNHFQPTASSTKSESTSLFETSTLSPSDEQTSCLFDVKRINIPLTEKNEFFEKSNTQIKFEEMENHLQKGRVDLAKASFFEALSSMDSAKENDLRLLDNFCKSVLLNKYKESIFPTDKQREYALNFRQYFFELLTTKTVDIKISDIFITNIEQAKNKKNIIEKNSPVIFIAVLKQLKCNKLSSNKPINIEIINNIAQKLIHLCKQTKRRDSINFIQQIENIIFS